MNLSEIKAQFKKYQAGELKIDELEKLLKAADQLPDFVWDLPGARQLLKDQAAQFQPGGSIPLEGSTDKETFMDRLYKKVGRGIDDVAYKVASSTGGRAVSSNWDLLKAAFKPQVNWGYTGNYGETDRSSGARSSHRDLLSAYLRDLPNLDTYKGHVIGDAIKDRTYQMEMQATAIELADLFSAARHSKDETWKKYFAENETDYFPFMSPEQREKGKAIRNHFRNFIREKTKDGKPLAISNERDVMGIAVDNIAGHNKFIIPQYENFVAKNPNITGYNVQVKDNWDFAKGYNEKWEVDLPHRLQSIVMDNIGEPFTLIGDVKITDMENEPTYAQHPKISIGESIPAQFQDGGGFNQFNTNYQEAQNYQRIKGSREGMRYNPDGTTSTHLMSDNNQNEAWPTLFQDPTGNWFEGGYNEAQRRGEIYRFDSKNELTNFARKGDWKNTYQNGGRADRKAAEQQKLHQQYRGVEEETKSFIKESDFFAPYREEMIGRGDSVDVSIKQKGFNPNYGVYIPKKNKVNINTTGKAFLPTAFEEAFHSMHVGVQPDSLINKRFIRNLDYFKANKDSLYSRNNPYPIKQPPSYLLKTYEDFAKNFVARQELKKYGFNPNDSIPPEAMDSLGANYDDLPTNVQDWYSMFRLRPNAINDFSLTDSVPMKQDGGFVNKTGYTRGTQTANNPYNIISSGNIDNTNTGKTLAVYPDGDPPMILNPGQRHIFPNSKNVLEIPIAQDGLGMKNDTIDYQKFKNALFMTETDGDSEAMNPTSSATGQHQLLHKLFQPEMPGVSRYQFSKRPKLQDKIFRKFYNNELEGFPGHAKTANRLSRKFENEPDMNLTKPEIAALSHIFGPTGAEIYMQDSLVDKKRLANIFPHLYGPEAKHVNMTPEQYLSKFTKHLSTPIPEPKPEIPLNPKFSSIPMMQPGGSIPANFDSTYNAELAFLNQYLKSKGHPTKQHVPYKFFPEKDLSNTSDWIVGQSKGDTVFLSPNIFNTKAFPKRSWIDVVREEQFHNLDTYERDPILIPPADPNFMFNTYAAEDAINYMGIPVEADAKRYVQMRHNPNAAKSVSMKDIENYYHHDPNTWVMDRPVYSHLKGSTNEATLLLERSPYHKSRSDYEKYLRGLLPDNLTQEQKEYAEKYIKGRVGFYNNNEVKGFLTGNDSNTPLDNYEHLWNTAMNAGTKGDTITQPSFWGGEEQKILHRYDLPEKYPHEMSISEKALWKLGLYNSPTQPTMTVISTEPNDLGYKTPDWWQENQHSHKSDILSPIHNIKQAPIHNIKQEQITQIPKRPKEEIPQKVPMRDIETIDNNVLQTQLQQVPQMPQTNGYIRNYTQEGDKYFLNDKPITQRTYNLGMQASQMKDGTSGTRWGYKQFQDGGRNEYVPTRQDSIDVLQHQAYLDERRSKLGYKRTGPVQSFNPDTIKKREEAWNRNPNAQVVLANPDQNNNFKLSPTTRAKVPFSNPIGNATFYPELGEPGTVNKAIGAVIPKGMIPSGMQPWGNINIGEKRGDITTAPYFDPKDFTPKGAVIKPVKYPEVTARSQQQDPAIWSMKPKASGWDILKSPTTMMKTQTTITPTNRQSGGPTKRISKHSGREFDYSIY